MLPLFLPRARFSSHARRQQPKTHRLESNQSVTNCNFCKSFLLIFIQNDGGLGTLHVRDQLLTNPKSLSSFFSYPCALFCPFLQFLALTENSTVLFSIASALFDKNRGVGPCNHGEASSSAPVSDREDNLRPARVAPFRRRRERGRCAPRSRCSP